MSRWIKASLWGLCSIPVILALLGALSFYFPTEAPVSKDIRLLRQLQKDYVSHMQENTNLVCASIGSTGLKPIEGFLFRFYCPQKIGRQQFNKARTIALNCSEILLNMINSNKSLKPYLVNHPFDHHNIKITVFFECDKNNSSENRPLWAVSIEKRGVVYKVEDNDGRLVRVKTEPYSEAIRLAKLEDVSL
jgi:hypothetical protein